MGQNNYQEALDRLTDLIFSNPCPVDRAAQVSAAIAQISTGLNGDDVDLVNAWVKYHGNNVTAMSSEDFNRKHYNF